MYTLSTLGNKFVSNVICIKTNPDQKCLKHYGKKKTDR